MSGAGGYEHAQRGLVHHALWALGVSLVAAGMFSPPAARPGMVAGGIISLLLAFTVAHLRTRDEGDRLDVRMGPVGIFGTSLRYADIERVEVLDIGILDGVGVHWTLGKGLLFNVRGGKCVTVTLYGGKRRSVGTDDPDGLAAFLRSRMPRARS